MEITFRFTDEERGEAERVLKATSFFSALWDISQLLRQLRKNEDSSINIEQLELTYYEILDSHNINLDYFD
jgi:hypothetical protein